MNKCNDDFLAQRLFKACVPFIINIVKLLTLVIALCIMNLFGVNVGASFSGGKARTKWGDTLFKRQTDASFNKTGIT